MLRKIYRSVAKLIPASKFGGAVINDEKLSQTKFKDHIVNEVLKKKSLTPYELEKILKEEGMVKSQLSKRQRLIKMITGGEKKQLTPEQVAAQKKKIKGMIAASRYSAEKYAESDINQLGCMAAKIAQTRGSKTGALRGGLVRGDRKVGAKDLGISGPIYQVTSQGGGGSAPSATAAANKMGGSASASANIRQGTGQLGGDSGVGQHAQPPIGFNRMG